jgi:hypothetical protein
MSMARATRVKSSEPRSGLGSSPTERSTRAFGRQLVQHRLGLRPAVPHGVAVEAQRPGHQQGRGLEHGVAEGGDPVPLCPGDRLGSSAVARGTVGRGDPQAGLHRRGAVPGDAATGEEQIAERRGIGGGTEQHASGERLVGDGLDAFVVGIATGEEVPEDPDRHGVGVAVEPVGDAAMDLLGVDVGEPFEEEPAGEIAARDGGAAASVGHDEVPGEELVERGGRLPAGEPGGGGEHRDREGVARDGGDLGQSGGGRTDPVDVGADHGPDPAGDDLG